MLISSSSSATASCYASAGFYDEDRISFVFLLAFVP